MQGCLSDTPYAEPILGRGQDFDLQQGIRFYKAGRFLIRIGKTFALDKHRVPSM